MHFQVQCYVKKALPSTNIAHCLEHCFKAGKQCNAVMFFHDKDECVLSEKTQYSNPEEFQEHEEVDYFDNVCDYRASTIGSLEKVLTEMTPSSSRLEGRRMRSESTQRFSEPDPRVVVEHDTLSTTNVELEPTHGR
ncbi:unnamed protein product [Gongylonema pulchrum]|uniref:Apple domain-containing protein n=1 Tax=Gongylonema pulchrum TaxID=637853 RepID=A0A183DDG5_9BILA|nr:unnamed protein product [Gongylonema pulchrum]